MRTLNLDIENYKKNEYKKHIYRNDFFLVKKAFNLTLCVPETHDINIIWRLPTTKNKSMFYAWNKERKKNNNILMICFINLYLNLHKLAVHRYPRLFPTT